MKKTAQSLPDIHVQTGAIAISQMSGTDYMQTETYKDIQNREKYTNIKKHKEKMEMLQLMKK